MTKEEKDLLLKDLCSRLPYGVKVNNEIQGDFEIYGICENFVFGRSEVCHIDFDVEKIKPYLYPLSSITKEQSIELFKLFGISLVDSIGTDYIKINECTGITFFLDKGFDIETHLDKLLDWLNRNHFDYRFLIEKGLAIDATGLNIYL